MRTDGVGATTSTPRVLAGHYAVVKSLAGGIGVVHVRTDMQDADRPVAFARFLGEMGLVQLVGARE